MVRVDVRFCGEANNTKEYTTLVQNVCSHRCTAVSFFGYVCGGRCVVQQR